MTTERRIRVLVVDDSAFARKVIRDALAADPRIEVIGHATDGLEALEKIRELSPDVVTMDLMMPELDGVEVLRALAQFPTSPRVVVVTTEGDDTAAAIAALQEGAFDIIVKPTKQATDRLYAVGHAVLEKVVLAAGGAPARPALPRAPRETPVDRRGNVELVVIGASTGGPRAVTLLLEALPADLAVPIAIVVHMPEGFTSGFAERLDRASPLHVFEARPGLIGAGEVAIAAAGLHLRVSRGAQGCELALGLLPADTMHRPSVDVLFESAAEACGGAVLGVLLTGMGSDGLRGAEALHARGARIVAQDEASCVVYGMPRAVVDAGIADAVLPLDGIVDDIVTATRARAR